MNAIEPKALNAALRGAFDAKDYFNGVSKALCLKAIEEAMGADMARQQAKKTKGEIAAFAAENVPETGWLPIQLRAKGYDGPPKAKALASNPKAKKAAKKSAKSRKANPARDVSLPAAISRACFRRRSRVCSATVLRSACRPNP